ncbi:MAG TPA: caspase family protein [Xanthobacteraceae bacterium]|nr:caspase family protein [Xanthobacteraceae bacterium]
MRFTRWGLLSWCAAGLVALGISGLDAAAAAPLLRGPDGGEVRALIIGVDAYQNVRPLKGAVADARDIESALRRMGTRDVTALIDAQADRASILREIGALVQRTNSGDMVVLSIAGHGAQEPERVKGSQPDGLDDVFLLPGFDTSPTGSQQRILGKEFHHFIKQLELRGAQVVFVADSCHGGGMARSIDPRSEEMSYRQVASYRVPVDLLQPVTTKSEEFMTELDFDRTAFLAAVDRKTKAPEVRIPGVEGLRGALSYAVARAVEGQADTDGDGKITVKELFTHVRQVVYQLSEQRQNIVTLTSPGRDIERDVAFQVTRGIQLVDMSDVSRKPSTLVSERTAEAASAAPKIEVPASGRAQRPVRLAALDGQSSHFRGLTRREAPFEIVQPVDYPDIIWDPKSRDVLAWGDVIAYKIDKGELASVIDRAAAVRDLKQIATRTPQAIRMMPDDRLQRRNTVVQVQVSELTDRALILFNITGDGTVQLLYPLNADPRLIDKAEFSLTVRVREPFGADQIIAVTSGQRMNALEEALTQLNGRRAAGQAIAMMQKFAPGDARIGATSLFTAP